MFEGISQSLDGAMSFFRSRGKLTEQNVQEGLAAVRQALLEADVNYQVAVDFTNRVAEQAIGQQVLKSVNPRDQFIYILHQELTNLMGPVDHTLNIRKNELTILMMCGLQGSGKTTTCGKLAKMLLDQKIRPMLVAADLQRPAAIEQLKVIGEQLGVAVYSELPTSNPVQVCLNGVAAARKSLDTNVVILDTAGRLHVDSDLMKELEQIDRRVGPHQVLLVCDAMTGQDAVNSAKAFNDSLELDGVILTKLDGDTRGGAALSIKAVTGVPIKYVGVGEQLDRLEPFHPERMASRILNLGDVVSLVEQMRKQSDTDEMQKQQEKLLKGRFTLTDFQGQMATIRKMGPIKDTLKLIPGMGKVSEMLGPDMDPETDFSQIDAMINSMTPKERENPDLIDMSRRRRIADGSGCEPSDVNQLLKQFSQMATMMKNVAGMGMRDRMKMMSQMGNAMQDPGAQIQAGKNRSKRGPLDLQAAAEKKKKKRKEKKKQQKKNRK